MKNTIFKIIRIVGTILAFFNSLMFFAMRPCWSGISATLGYKGGDNKILYILPVIIFVFLFVLLLSDLIIKKIFNKNWIHLMYLIISIVFFIVVIVVIVLGAIDYMRFIWPKFFTSLLYLDLLLFLYFLIFIYPKTAFKDNNYVKYGTIGVSTLIVVLILLNFSINKITYEPVVYAVEDNYQIIFSTKSKATGWVTIGDKSYYDTYNGSTRKFDKVHKIEVPMSVLDSEKEYTVHTQKSIYCGPFGGFLGRDITKTLNFKPVDTSDGIQYLSFSDIHMNLDVAKKTASFIDNYDFLVLDGDIISDVETFDDANFNNLVAYSITKGEIPVVYARGNHDVKGEYAEQLHKFVGTKDDKFYFNFYFKDVYGIVLDLGEDHDDDWWEYYGTAHYEDYQDKQIEFLTEEVNSKNFENFKYHLAVCHIPIVFVNYRHNQEEVKANMTNLLNQMDIDMLLCGHQHELMIFEPGLITPNTKLSYNSNYKTGTYKGYLTDFNFPSLMISKQGFTFSDSNKLAGAKSHIGLFIDVDLNTKKELCYYLNSRGEKVEVMNMFYEKTYGTEITIDLETKEFTSK
ncbi:MAG: metallophosphoesterase [Gammaproteobacteria bacterium]|nr:metallophosphoesterase [Gammaproteobacteria bacterium]